MAIKVTLRKKPISKGRYSLYLDFYPAIPHPKTGKPTRREFLNLYISQKPKTSIDKQYNTETLKIGENIKQKKENFGVFQHFVVFFHHQNTHAHKHGSLVG